MIIKVINKSENLLPVYETQGSSGMDLLANEDIEIFPFQRKLVKTGLFVEIPEGYELQIRSRSGNALKHGIMVLNSPGTIDSDYRGEIGVILLNTDSLSTFKIEKGKTKIAQAILCKVEKVEGFTAKQLTDTERGEGGFGSTTK